MKYVIIVGGELFNKGAQSMTFVTVDEIKKRYPDKDIILFSNRDYNRDLSDKLQYTFKIMPAMDLKLMFYFQGGIWRIIAKTRKIEKSYLDELSNILENTDIMIDVSGYLLGSNWGVWRSLMYLLRIKTAKCLNIKTYLFPQSFGPFNYQGAKGLLINFLIRKYLKYPKIVYVRENEGYELLTKKYKLSNVELSNDLVLMNKELVINNIYNRIPENESFELDNSMSNVAIIPNMKNFKYGNKADIIDLYIKIIDRLINLGKNVYLLRHAVEDIEACNIIKEKFVGSNNIMLIPNEFSCFEYDKLVKRFDFVVASRYHSIVHAYKNGIPCIAIGWATKYHELLKNFNQEEYIFDVRNHINFTRVYEAIELMNKNHLLESDKIKDTLHMIQRVNIFDVLEES